MDDVSFKNSEKYLKELGYTELSHGVWFLPAHMAKTPGVGMIDDTIAKIEDTLVTTYIGHVGNGNAGYIDLEPEKHHRTILFTRMPVKKDSQ